MKKYLIGFLVGAVLSVSATTYAADVTTLIGKAVQGVFPVKVNGNALPQTAVVIDGTSYLPVRAIGDATGYDVSFNADLGIELKKKEVATMTTSAITSSDITETTYNGLSAILSNNETYFSLRDYSIKFNPISWDFNHKTNIISLSKHIKDSTEIVETYTQVDKNELGAVLVYKGTTYINTKYYSEH